MRNLIKHSLLLSLGVVALLSFSGCGGAAVNPAHQKAVNAHQKVYTQMNMWASPATVTTTNYSVGFKIPVNSMVFYEGVNSKQVKFTYNDKVFYLRNVPKYSQLTMDGVLDRYFNTQKVDLSKFSKAEQDAIKAGNVIKGMSKEAVLVARGYPPAHATPDLSMDEWTYWKFQRGFVSDTIKYLFKNNKVVDIVD